MSNLAGWEKGYSPFHEGERVFHERYGITERMEAIGQQYVRPFMPDEHRIFFAQLPFLVVGSVDDGGRPWASMLFGQPGFVSSPDSTTLEIAALPLSGDPLERNVKEGAQVSFLGIEPPTRRRNRVNATITAVGQQGIAARVDQSFGNCPKYIQSRSMEFLRDPAGQFSAPVEMLAALDDAARSLISASDTLYVASRAPRGENRDVDGVDVNHRGGTPGFVKVEGDTLTIPDYAGNNFFNSLGNMIVNPKAGLYFVDFDSGDSLQLTGATEILWEDHPEVKAFRGAQRAWRLTVAEGVRLRAASPLRWSFNDYSHHLSRTGTWDAASVS